MVDKKYDLDGYGDERPDVDNKDLYKKFGRENDVGKLLYGMYAQKEKPKIYYPPVKTKVRGHTPPKEEKKCPQKAAVEYPEMPKKNKFKFAPIDFVPRRKPGEEILGAMEKDKKRPIAVAPGKIGVNRAEMIENLQERNQFEDLDAYNRHIQMQKKMKEHVARQPVSDKQRRQARFKGGIAQRALQHYEQKYGKSPALATVLSHKDKQSIQSEQDAELEDLFESVVEEIEERQEHLESLGDAADKQMQERIKNEIIERIGELQKIKELQSRQL